jgi:hypothetical protein
MTFFAYLCCLSKSVFALIFFKTGSVVLTLRLTVCLYKIKQAKSLTLKLVKTKASLAAISRLAAGNFFT